MACETGLSWKNCLVEGGTDGVAWTDLSGWSNAMEISGGERQTAETYTSGCDTAIITAGKRGPLTVTLNALYTETADEPYALAKTAYEGATPFYLRWSPLGGNTGELQFTTAAGIVTDPPYPVGDASNADPLMVSVVLQTPEVVEAVAA